MKWLLSQILSLAINCVCSITEYWVCRVTIKKSPIKQIRQSSHKITPHVSLFFSAQFHFLLDQHSSRLRDKAYSMIHEMGATYKHLANQQNSLPSVVSWPSSTTDTWHAADAGADDALPGPNSFASRSRFCCWRSVYQTHTKWAIKFRNISPTFCIVFFKF